MVSVIVGRLRVVVVVVAVLFFFTFSHGGHWPIREIVK